MRVDGCEYLHDNIPLSLLEMKINNMIKTISPRATHKLRAELFVFDFSLRFMWRSGGLENKNIQREEYLGKMLTFSVLHVALKNSTFRQWRCYQDRLVSRKQFYTTQISNLKTQSLKV